MEVDNKCTRGEKEENRQGITTELACRYLIQFKPTIEEVNYCGSTSTHSVIVENFDIFMLENVTTEETIMLTKKESTG